MSEKRNQGKGCINNPLILVRTYCVVDKPTGAPLGDLTQTISVADLTSPEISNNPPEITVKSVNEIPDPDEIGIKTYIGAKDQCSGSGITVKFDKDEWEGGEIRLIK